MNATAEGYPLGIRILHWATALLIATQLALALTNALVYERLPVTAEAVVQTHISLGALVLLFTLVRLLCRAALATPALPPDMTAAARLAARFLHAALYVLLLALPVTGYIKLAALGFEIRIFGWPPLPPLPVDVQLSATARDMHFATSACLGALLVLHIAAALFHTRLFGSPVMQRMWPHARGTAQPSGAVYAGSSSSSDSSSR